MPSKAVNLIRKVCLYGAVTAIIGAFLSTPATAQSRPACPQLKNKIEFSVTARSRAIEYDVNATHNQLTKMANKSPSSRLKSNERPLGLTINGHIISYRMTSQIARLASNRYCARVASVAMKINITKLKVYVLNKYRRGSCQYAAVIDHEHEHVATFQNGIETLERTFNEHLWSLIRNLQPSSGSTSAQATRRALKKLDAAISRIKKPIERRMIARNRQIDTPLSYKRLIQQCRRW